MGVKSMAPVDAEAWAAGGDCHIDSVPKSGAAVSRILHMPGLPVGDMKPAAGGVINAVPVLIALATVIAALGGVVWFTRPLVGSLGSSAHPDAACDLMDRRNPGDTECCLARVFVDRGPRPALLLDLMAGSAPPGEDGQGMCVSSASASAPT